MSTEASNSRCLLVFCDGSILVHPEDFWLCVNEVYSKSITLVV